MDNSSTLDTKPQTVPPKKHSTKALITYGIILLLIGVLTVVGWLYYNSNRKIDDQQKQIGDLQQQLESLGIEAPVGLGGEDSTPCNSGSAYSAEIGNFALTLSSPNTIIRNLDANFEGGPVTDLSIGQCTAGEVNVVDAHLTHKVNIIAHPAENAATLRSNFEAEWGSPLVAGASVTIDGEAAQTYTGDGLFATKLIYFDHVGIGYQIELPDSNPISEAMLTDVIADWSFTP